ncbi:MinD/ParA family ATP-binding protein [Microbacterium pumilum]|uniref:AAA domain-containing protein n=1 Tax=Microbacterium pumilum TaxID=344165 RepID=A0ABN2S2W6_9MICO
MTIAPPPQRAYAAVNGSSATFVLPDGGTETVRATEQTDIRQAIVDRAAAVARKAATPVELVTTGDRGEHHLLVDATGTVTSLIERPVEHGTVVRGAAVDTANGEEVRNEAQRLRRTTVAAEPPTRTSFIEPARGERSEGAGWRGLIGRIGIHVHPSTAELARAEHAQTVSRHWAGCRTIAVANGKGGVGKTITTAMLAAVYGRYGGGNVLAWDNNDTRGTLGWRTESGLYDATIRDLLPAASTLLAPTASVSDISAFVHHQSADRYDVLRSNPELLAVHQRIAHAEFDVLMQVAARYYRLVVFDSGNDESADRWLRMVDSSYQLVIPTLTAPESAESAALLLDALRERDERSAALADNAVIVLTHAEPVRASEARRIVEGFEGYVRAVETVPFDPALKSGPLRFDSLRPATRDAWLRVAAAAASSLEAEPS